MLHFEYEIFAHKSRMIVNELRLSPFLDVYIACQQNASFPRGSLSNGRGAAKPYPDLCFRLLHLGLRSILHKTPSVNTKNPDLQYVDLGDVTVAKTCMESLFSNGYSRLTLISRDSMPVLLLV